MRREHRSRLNNRPCLLAVKICSELLPVMHRGRDDDPSNIAQQDLNGFTCTAQGWGHALKTLACPRQDIYLMWREQTVKSPSRGIEMRMVKVRERGDTSSLDVLGLRCQERKSHTALSSSKVSRLLCTSHQSRLTHTLMNSSWNVNLGYKIKPRKPEEINACW